MINSIPINKFLNLSTFMSHHNKVVECHSSSEHPIPTKIWTFSGKGSSFEITLEKSFFVHIAVNVNISRKSTLFWDHFEKSFFDQISENINISRKRTFFKFFLKNLSFIHISVNINISFLRSFLKISFLFIYPFFWDLA